MEFTYVQNGSSSVLTRHQKQTFLSKTIKEADTIYVMVHMEENARKQPSYICVCSLCPLFSFNQIAYSSRIRYNISTSIQRMKRFDNATINNECPSEMAVFLFSSKSAKGFQGEDNQLPQALIMVIHDRGLSVYHPILLRVGFNLTCF